MTTTITRLELLCETIVAADRAAAECSAEATIIARAQAEAPYTYEQLKAANAERAMGELLAELDAAALRLQAIRFLAERGAAWGWGEVDAVVATFGRLVEAWQAEQRALAMLEIANAVHNEAIEAGCSPEVEAEAREAHLGKADIYFARRAAREALERDAFPAPRLPKAQIRQRIADLKRADIAARRHTHPRSERRTARGW